MAVEIRGAGGKDAGGRNPVEQANNLFSVAFASMVFLLSEGEIAGFPHELDSGNPQDRNLDIFLDGTSLMSIVRSQDAQQEQKRLNFRNVSTTFLPGTDTQEPIPGYTTVENTVSVGVMVTQEIGAVTRTITDPDVERVRVIIQHPSLQSINASNGDTTGTSVTYSIKVQSNGGQSVEIHRPTVSGKSSGQFQRAYEIDLTASPLQGSKAPWEISVERITADSTSGLLSNQIIWQAYTEIVDEMLAYPNSALLAVKVDARQFNAIPDVKVRLRGKKVQVPAAPFYNPATRAYSGIWDGTWQLAWSDNPAWVFRDLVVNRVYGLRRYLKTADVDRWTLLSIARYCDELVPDGMGGTEPRFRANVYLQNEGNVFEVLNAMASIFRGMIHYVEGKLFLTQDRPATPVQQFSEANVLQDVDESGRITTPPFVYQGTSRTARKSVVLVSWDDPDQLYNQVTEYLQDDELLRRYGYNPTDLRLLGVTSRGQAVRAARFVLFNNRYCPDKVSFRVGAEGLASGIGDVIQIADPLRQGQRLGGRIKAISGNRVTLDMVFTPQQGVSYTLTLVDPDGVLASDGSGRREPSLNTYTVNKFQQENLDSEVSYLVVQDELGGYHYLTTDDNPAQGQSFDPLIADAEVITGNTIVVLSEPVSATPGSLWVLEWVDMQAALYRIISISETEPFIFQIEALPYNESAYDYIDRDDPVVVAKDRFVTDPSTPPGDLVAGLDYRNGQVVIAADWIAPQLNGADDLTINGYVYQWRLSGATLWSPVQETPYTDALIPLDEFVWGSTYEVQVASRNRLGQQSDWTQVEVTPLAPLPDISDSQYGANLTHINQPDGGHLMIVDRRDYPLPERLAGYRLWAKPISGLVGELPGSRTPVNGWYELVDIPLTGYYSIVFHAPATYELRVAPISAVAGEPPTWEPTSQSTAYLSDTINKSEIVPPTPLNFTVVQAQAGALKRFSWRLDTTSAAWPGGVVTDIAGYVTRYRQGALGDVSLATAWGLGIELLGTPANQTWFETSLFQSGGWLVMLRSTDVTGNLSDITSVFVTATDPPISNVVVEGTIDLSSDLTLEQNAQVTGSPAVVSQIDPTQDTYFTWLFDNNDISSQLLINTTASGSYQHWIAALTGVDMPILMEDGTEILMEDDTVILAEQRDYSGGGAVAGAIFHPYAPGEQLTEDMYMVRTLLRSLDGTTAASISAIGYVLDYPDVIETFASQSIANTGTTLTLTKAFTAVLAVQVTPHSGGTAVTGQVVSRSTTQVVVKVLDSTGAAVAGTADITVQGY